MLIVVFLTRGQENLFLSSPSSGQPFMSIHIKGTWSFLLSTHNDHRRSEAMKRPIAICVFLIFLLASAAVFITLGVLFLIKRDVTFDVVPPQLSGTTSLRSLATGDLPIPVTVHVVNENFFPITLRNLTVSAAHPAYSSVLGTGSLHDSIHLKRRGNTTFIVPFVLSYSDTHDPGQGYLSSALSNCSQVTGILAADVSISAAYDTWVQDGLITRNLDFSIRCSGA